jgi:Zn-dependent protease
VVMMTASGMLIPGVNSSGQAIVLLGIAAVEINLALFFFNLLPIPPLDGSSLLRNILPYNAVQSYDRIPMWVSWCLMIFVGGYIMRLLLSPAFAIVGLVLSKG